MAIDIPSSSGSNLSSLRKFMDNFMQNLLEMGMSLDQARAQSKIWLDRQMQEYAKSLENQKTMEEIRTRNDYGLLGARTTAEAAAAKTAYQRNLVEKYFDPRYYEKLPQGNLQAISALKSALPEEAWQETGFVYSPEIEQKISEATKAGTIGIDDLQNLRKTDPKTLTTIVRTFGFDRTIELAKGTLGGTEANVRNALTDKGFGLEQQRINLGLAQLAAKEPGVVKTEKLSDVDKIQIAEINKNLKLITPTGTGKFAIGGIESPGLANQARIVFGRIKNKIYHHQELNDEEESYIADFDVNEINATRNLNSPSTAMTPDEIAATARTTSVPIQPSAVPTTPAVAAPLVSPRDIYYNRLIANGVPEKDALTMTIAKFGK
jgi:hypothetical protein